MHNAPEPPGQPPFELNPAKVDQLQARLFDHHRIELPIFNEPNMNVRCLRVSVQTYNNIEQIERLADALKMELT